MRRTVACLVLFFLVTLPVFAADPCATPGACCVDPARCVITDRQTLAGLTVDSVVPCGFTLGQYVLGGNDDTGAAPFPPGNCGLSFASYFIDHATAINSLDHQYFQSTDTPIVVDFGTTVNAAFVFPAVDHGPFPEEGIETTVWGNSSPSLAGFPTGWTRGTLTTIWKRGWEDPVPCQGQDNADDFVGQYSFQGAGFQYVAVDSNFSISIFDDPSHASWSASGDDSFVPGWQSFDDEIDAIGTPVCQPGQVVANAGPDQVADVNGQVCFSSAGSSGGQISWDLDNDGVIDVTAPVACRPCSAGGEGDVTLYVTDACGCVATDTAHYTCVPCPTCNGSTVIVTQNTVADLNPAVPTCTGDPALCGFFTWDKTGPTADTWKAIFDIGARSLLVTNNSTITTATVPLLSNNRRAPGIEIRSTCTATIDAGSGVVVTSVNQPAGPIVIDVHGDVTINGTVRNEVTGTNGRPGSISVNTTCGSIRTGPTSHVQTIGVDHGGSDINLTSCGPGVVTGGNIVINGLVDASYKGESAATINVNAYEGFVTINGNNVIEIEAGTQRRVTSGVTVRSRRDPLAGFINIQAGTDVTVLGNQLLTTNPATQNYGAVAIKPGGTNGTSGDGAMKVVALNGRIIASNRAFDFANRFNALNDITLAAHGDISLTSTVAGNAVVSTQGGDTGRGGTNSIRSYCGGITIGSGAQVLANFTGRPGSNGTNNLASDTGISNSGAVLPADMNGADDATGVCAPGPVPILCGCDGNLIVNGSFEDPSVSPSFIYTGAIPGWTAVAGAIEIGDAGLYGVTGASGSQVLELDSFTNSRVRQVVLTTPGLAYDLRFKYAQRAGTSPSTNEIHVYWNGGLIATLVPSSTAFAQYATVVVAPLAATTLDFEAGGASDSLGGMLDSVSLTCCDCAP